MNIADLYRKVKKILDDSNEFLANKGLDRVDSLSKIPNELNKLGKIDILTYFLNAEVDELSEFHLDSVTSIGDYAFYNCASLTNITIPDSVTSIGSSAFEGCTGLTSAYIGNGVTSIDDYAFRDCSSLTSITIPNSVTSIGRTVFYNCASLTNITIPNGVTVIGDYAFANTAYYNDKSNWENGVLYIGKHLIKAEESISGAYSIKSGTSTIAYSAFYDCTSLKSITIPDSVTSIVDYAFYNCSSLTSVVIPDSVASIGDSAFSWCQSLTNITIPDSVTSIEDYAFYGCENLASVTIPNSVTSIGRGVFEYSTSIRHVYLYAVVPPTLGSASNNMFSQYVTIHVPVGSGAAYKSATNWSYYASKIVEDIVIE